MVQMYLTGRLFCYGKLRIVSGEYGFQDIQHLIAYICGVDYFCTGCRTVSDDIVHSQCDHLLHVIGLVHRPYEHTLTVLVGCTYYCGVHEYMVKAQHIDIFQP